MKETIYLCDFNDSFTYKIYSEILISHPLIHIEVIDHKNLLRFFQNLPAPSCKIILGPGPGHPNDYEYLFNSLKKVFVSNDHYFLGICLGHQLLCTILGIPIKHCLEPKHGYQEEYHLPKELSQFLGLDEYIRPQRYNSLAPKISAHEIKKIPQITQFLIQKEELIIAIGERFISYQFHPESVGTKNSGQYFNTFLEL